MTPSQLRQWSFQNSQPDQWWLSLDAVMEEIPVTVVEIEERLKSGDYSTVQALHVSQAGMENAPWVEVAMPPAMKAPPIMQPMVAAITPAPSLPSHPIASIATPERSKPDETLGIIILLIPLIGIFLMWYSPATLLFPLSALIVASTAILVGVEANKLGVGKEKKFDKKGREKRQTGPVGWAIFVLVVWLVGFPSYLYWRSRYGAKNMLIGGIGVAILFLAITSLTGAMPFPTNHLVNQPQRQYQNIDLGSYSDLEEQTNASLEEIHKQVARDAMKQYEITMRNGSAMDRYVQASMVAAAFLQAKDEVNYKAWKSIEKLDAIEAGIE
jgi:4-amino-4-deoxy-L-arabinose transferase-like glycosyltransferase